MVIHFNAFKNRREIVTDEVIAERRRRFVNKDWSPTEQEVLNELITQFERF